MLKRVAIIGHFGDGETLLNGQTIKTKIITAALEKKIGSNEVLKVDTHGGFKAYLRLPFQLFNSLRRCTNAIILPAQRGLGLIAPMLVVSNVIFRRKLHYVVIGGWLPEWSGRKKKLRKCLKHLDAIYVETSTMKRAMDEQGFENVLVMPNFKDLKILEKPVVRNHFPRSLCTFSRVMKEKGIEDAVKAVSIVNRDAGKTVVTLDIYGQIEASQNEWFEQLKQSFPEYISYRGIIPYDKSVSILQDYDILLFPTYYEGEGFAGTLLDAMAAGIPVIASDWKYNKDIVNEHTGVLVEPRNIEQLASAIESTIFDRYAKEKILHEARRFLPENAILVLCENLR